MSEYTPGPWRIIEPDGTEEPGNALAGIFTDDRLIATTWKSSHATSGSAWANAHLIAAAPELLEALKFVLAENVIRHEGKARDAIAKAQGVAGGSTNAGQ